MREKSFDEKVASLTLIKPLKFETLEPQPGAAATTVPCHASTGGVIVRYPASMRYMRDDYTLPWWFPLLRAWWAVRRFFKR